MDLDTNGREAISHLYLHSPGPEPRYFVQPNVQSWLCKLIDRCHGDPECVYWWTWDLRVSDKPTSWNDPLLRQAENWSYAAAYPGIVQTSTPSHFAVLLCIYDCNTSCPGSQDNILLKTQYVFNPPYKCPAIYRRRLGE